MFEKNKTIGQFNIDTQFRHNGQHTANSLLKTYRHLKFLDS